MMTRDQAEHSGDLLCEGGRFRVTRRGVCALGLLAMLAAARVQAADWPTRTVSVVVPYAPGGFTDILARLAAKHLSDKFNQAFVIENRLGAGGSIGATYVANA